VRLVVVSNRVTQVSKTKPAAGGLAVGVHSALADLGGIWFGWSGQTTAGEVGQVRRSRSGKITYALTDLSEDEFAGYYAGFANRTLWPLCHYRIDLASFEHEWWAVYRRVNERFAQALAPLLEPDDLVWVHDYHLIPMASELRRLGVQARLGFFLHTPFPAAQVLVVLPWHRQLAADLCAYDVVGFQTPTDLQQFRDYLARELRGELDGTEEIGALGRRLRGIACPIGIDVEEMAALGSAPEARTHAERMRTALRRRNLVMGVDRLDYSKGIPERLRAFEILLRDHPEHRGSVSFLQISAPSREDVPEYVSLRTEVEQLAGAIGGRYGEPDWMPLRYINRTYPRRALAGFFRLARVGFLTPLRDGLNLVAEEFVAAQDPADPGVLVLSRFAGAASVLEHAGALIVNPYDVYDSAGALHRALNMSEEERAERLKSMLAAIRDNDITTWRRRFVAALEAVPVSGSRDR
jgi:trehalose 6-phosphate synthase